MLLLGLVLYLGGLDGVFLLQFLSEQCFLCRLFLRCGIGLAEEVDLDGRRNLHLVHLVGIGEAERAVQVHQFAGSLDTAYRHGTVADDFDVEILGGDEFVGGARHVGLHLADGQLAA